MKKKFLLVTGSCGLVGSEIVDLLHRDFDHVYGLDNNSRKFFFGNGGDTSARREMLQKNVKNYTHVSLDIKNRKKIIDFVAKIKPNTIIHCAGQPSHDLAAKIPFQDFDTNTVGTFNLLEATRMTSDKIKFIFLSTNKVYGDHPNNIELKEGEKRYFYKDKNFINGIGENMSIDQCTHSLFGSSKLSADIMVQEYGRYFNISTCCIRAGCITGPYHSGVELHGFLNYLIKSNLSKKKYVIFGYKGKQVRDNIHARDLVFFIKHFLNKPRVAEVYNIGGGYQNTISILEAFDKVYKHTNIKMISSYSSVNRVGDHICYYSDLSKDKKHYPNWEIKIDLDQIFFEIIKNFSQNKK
jgi:CDP-paratose 2-epimerase